MQATWVHSDSQAVIRTKSISKYQLLAYSLCPMSCCVESPLYINSYTVTSQQSFSMMSFVEVPAVRPILRYDPSVT